MKNSKNKNVKNHNFHEISKMIQFIIIIADIYLIDNTHYEQLILLEFY